MADSTVKKESCKKDEDKPLKGVTGKTSFTEENKAEKNDEPGNAKPNSFTWTGKRKSNPIETNKFDMKPGAKAGSGITIKLNAPDAKKKKAEPGLQKKAGSVAAVFGDDDSEEEEEIPPEARMRMRNIGRDTPTSAGPNSFNKGKRGFTHQRKVFEKQLNELKPP